MPHSTHNSFFPLKYFEWAPNSIDFKLCFSSVTSEENIGKRWKQQHICNKKRPFCGNMFSCQMTYVVESCNHVESSFRSRLISMKMRKCRSKWNSPYSSESKMLSMMKTIQSISYSHLFYWWKKSVGQNYL